MTFDGFWFSSGAFDSLKQDTNRNKDTTKDNAAKEKIDKTTEGPKKRDEAPKKNNETANKTTKSVTINDAPKIISKPNPKLNKNTEDKTEPPRKKSDTGKDNTHTK